MPSAILKVRARAAVVAPIGPAGRGVLDIPLSGMACAEERGADAPSERCRRHGNCADRGSDVLVAEVLGMGDEGVLRARVRVADELPERRVNAAKPEFGNGIASALATRSRVVCSRRLGQSAGHRSRR